MPYYSNIYRRSVFANSALLSAKVKRRYKNPQRRNVAHLFSKRWDHSFPNLFPLPRIAAVYDMDCV